MASMKAALLVSPGQFEIVTRALPEIGPDDVLIKVTRCGICGTDTHMFNGHYARERLPLVPGHEFVGRVVALGARVSGLREGQKVVADINIGCGQCYWCQKNEILNCPDAAQIGITRDGAFAEYVAAPARLVIAAPEATDDAVLALTEPVACVVRAARKARTSFGQSVAILGAGPIGNLHVQMMRLIGAAPIVVADLSAERCDMAAAVGADQVVTDPSRLQEIVWAMTDGRGADVVIESVGSAKLYLEATRLVRKGGHVAAFGLTGSEVELPLNIQRTILEELSIKGSVAGTGEDMRDALTLLIHGRFNTEAFTRKCALLEDIQTIFETLSEDPSNLKTQIMM